MKETKMMISFVIQPFLLVKGGGWRLDASSRRHPIEGIRRLQSASHQVPRIDRSIALKGIDQEKKREKPSSSRDDLLSNLFTFYTPRAIRKVAFVTSASRCLGSY